MVVAGRSQLPLVPPRHIFLGVRLLKRRLTDLYVLGKEITFDDGGGDPIVVYIQKLTPVDQEHAIRRANAARATYVTGIRDKESEVAKDLLAQAMDLGPRDELISFLNVGKLAAIRSVKEAENADEEEWSKDSYLQGLFDAWNDGLDQVHAVNDSSDPYLAEAIRVFEEMKRFNSQVDELMVEETTVLRNSLESESLAHLQEDVADEIADMNGNNVWLREYRRCEIWFCTREPTDHKKRYFGTREEVNELSSEVYDRLILEFSGLSVESSEGKDLPPKDSSLPLSESPEPEGTIPSSGPPDALL